MPKACDLKKGNVVDINGDPYMVKHIDVRTPSARGAVTLYKIRFNNMDFSSINGIYRTLVNINPYHINLT